MEVCDNPNQHILVILLELVFVVVCDVSIHSIGKQREFYK